MVVRRLISLTGILSRSSVARKSSKQSPFDERQNPFCIFKFELVTFSPRSHSDKRRGIEMHLIFSGADHLAPILEVQH